MMELSVGFLKPEKKKTVLAVVVFFVFPVVFPWLDDDCPRYEHIVGVGAEPCDKTAVRVSVGWVAKAVYEEFTRPPTWITASFEIRDLPPSWYPFYYIYHLFTSYVISCIITSLLEKNLKGG